MPHRFRARPAVALGAMMSACLLLAPIARADWITAETPHFIIYSDASEATVRDYARQMEAFRSVTDVFYNEMSDTDLTDAHKTRLNLLARVSEFQVVRPELAADQFTPYYPCDDGTQYFSTADVNSMNAPGDPVDLNLAFLYMAYNHQRELDRFETALPGWAATGLNWYFMSMLVHKDRVEVGRPYPRIAAAYDRRSGTTTDLTQERKRIPFAAVMAGRPLGNDRQTEVALASWVMVAYLMNDPARRAKFIDFIHRVQKGETPDDAYAAAIGFPPATYEAAMDAYMDKGVPVAAYTLTAATDADVIVTKLPRFKTALPLLDAATRACPSAAYAADLEKRLGEEAARQPDDVMAQEALARARIRAGHAAAALPWLKSRVAAVPDDFDARLLLGQAWLDVAKNSSGEARASGFRAARNALGEAYKLDPASAPALFYFALAHADLPDYPDDNTLKALDLAQSYSGGHYEDYKAEFQLRRGDYDGALKSVSEIRDHTAPNQKKALALIAPLYDALAAKRPAAEILPLFDAVHRYHWETEKP